MKHLLIPIALLTITLSTPIRAVERQIVLHKVPAAAKNAAPTGQSSRWKRLDLAISLPWRNQAALARLLQELYDPASTNYHRYLTPQ